MNKDKKFELWNEYVQAALIGFTPSIKDMATVHTSVEKINTMAITVCCGIADLMVGVAEKKEKEIENEEVC